MSQPLQYGRAEMKSYEIVPATKEVKEKIGRGERIRTSDHMHPMHVRYQAALHPEKQAGIVYRKHRFRKIYFV